MRAQKCKKTNLNLARVVRLAVEKEWVVKHRCTCTQVYLGDVLPPVRLQDA